MKVIFFLLLSISLILSQNINENAKNEGKKKLKEETSKLKNKNLNLTNNNLSQEENRNKNPPLNMTNDEMDKIMLCTAVVQDVIKQKQKDLEKVKNKLKLSNMNMLVEKVGTVIFEKCTKKMDMKTVNKYFKNLNLLTNYEWEKSFNEYLKVDFEQYHNTSDLTFTPEQELLMYKFNKVNELFRQKRGEYEAENRKIRIGNFDFESIPSSFKLSIFLIILALFFGGMFYFLKTLQRKPKDKKKKDKEKRKKN